MKSMWAYDEPETYDNIPFITLFSVKAHSFTDSQLFTSHFIYTLVHANSLVRENAPGFRNDFWISEDETSLQPDDAREFTVDTLLQANEVFRTDNLAWLQNIFRHFLIRHVVEMRSTPEWANRTIKPASFWLYHYTDRDIGLVALNILGLNQVPVLHNVDKVRIGALTNILGALLTQGARAVIATYTERVGRAQPPRILKSPQFATKFALLCSLIMSRSNTGFNKTNSYAPNGELNRIDRELSYVMRWFQMNQDFGAQRIPSWLTHSF
jgi:hypothetical protein